MLRVEPGGSKKPVVVTRPASPWLAPASKPRAAPVVVSEHGRGGGSGAADTGRKPTAAETRTGYTAPAGTKAAAVQPAPAVTFVSEHGQGGGSGPGVTGRKPTAAETRTGYTAPVKTKTAGVQPAPATTFISEHGQGGGSGPGDTGRKPTVAEIHTGYAAPPRKKSTAVQPRPTPAFVSEHGQGGGSVPAPQRADDHGVSGLFHRLHEEVTHAVTTAEHEASNVVHSIAHDTSPAIRAIERDAKKLGEAMRHLGPKVARASEGVAVNTGKLIEHGAKAYGKAELQAIRSDLKLGKEFAAVVKNNPSTVAWVTGTLALLTPFPLDVALAMISATASADAARKDLHDRRYVALAFDVTAIAAGATGLAARPLEGLANAEHAATAGRLNTLAETLAVTKDEPVPRLSDDQESALGRLVHQLNRTRGRAQSARELRRRADLTAAVAAFLGDPLVDPAARVRRR